MLDLAPLSSPTGRTDILPVGSYARDNERAVARWMLEKVARRCGDKALPDRLFGLYDQGKALIELIYEDHGPIGVLGLTPRIDHLYIDALYLNPGAMTKDRQMVIDAHVDARARRMGFDRVRTYTVRRAGEAVVAPYRYRAIGTLFEKRLEA